METSQDQDLCEQDSLMHSQLPPEPEPDYDDQNGVGDDNDMVYDDFGDFPPPPSPLTLQSLPTYQFPDDNDNNNNNNTNDNTSDVMSSSTVADSSTTTGEVTGARRVLPPGVMSKEREALHRELLLNHRTGRAVPQKTELSRVLAERKASQKRQEWQQQQKDKRTSLELKLEQRKERLQLQTQEEHMQGITEGEVTSELAKIHRRITMKAASPSPTSSSPSPT